MHLPILENLPILGDFPLFKKSRLIQQLHSGNLLVAEQHVFRQAISTEHADIRLTDSILSNLIKKEKNVEGNFCDLAKIFDCVNQEILSVNHISIAFKELLQTGSGHI
jgi:hypothetical protein